MSTKINYEKYGLSRFRYEELNSFCRQYDEYKKQRKSASAAQREYLDDKIKLIEKTAKEVCADYPGIYSYLLKNVTQGEDYYKIGPPLKKNSFYKLRRNFFVLLNKRKD